ncbi:hypothetical protein [Actinokineospora xionganensis]|uniref:Secreted protein n=1 Tax=Actinokineospora xionganensis TaxID=2684470 RepID=A0ABR7LF58_9PSEU|nr:hypothetical protein [Actinokineospora xionganensis]MBC6451262.1 hypothetical protein [Actinokineospora xionganensis]
MRIQPTRTSRRGSWSAVALLVSSLLALAVALCPPHQDTIGAAPVAAEQHLDGCGVAAHERHVPDPVSTPGVPQGEPVATEFSTPLAELEAVITPCAPLPRPSGRALLVEISVARS